MLLPQIAAAAAGIGPLHLPPVPAAELDDDAAAHLMVDLT